MGISQELEAVYKRALLLRQYAVESPVPQDLLDKELKELYFVLEELQTSQEDLNQQHQELIATRQAVDWERQRYQTLFDLAPNGYLVTDLRGVIHQANHHAALLLGAHQDLLVGKRLLVFVYELDRPFFQTQLANLSPQQTWEVRLSPRNGSLTSVSIAATCIKDVQTRRERLLWSIHDITDSR